MWKSYTFLTTFIEKSHRKKTKVLCLICLSLSFLRACSSIEWYKHIYIAIALYADVNVKNWKGLCFVYRIGTNTLACVFASTHIHSHKHTHTHDSSEGADLFTLPTYVQNKCCTYQNGIVFYFTISAEIHCLFFIKCRKCNSILPIYTIHTEEQSTTVCLQYICTKCIHTSLDAIAVASISLFPHFHVHYSLRALYKYGVCMGLLELTALDNLLIMSSFCCLLLLLLL